MQQEIRILHPSKEGKDGSVLLPERHGLHVIKDTDVPKNLTDTFCRPHVEREVLNANLGMEGPVRRSGVRVKAPRLEQKHCGANGHRASMKCSIALLRVIEVNKEMLRLMRGHMDAPMGGGELTVLLVGHICSSDLWNGVDSGEDDSLMTQLLKFSHHGPTNHHCSAALGRALTGVASHVAINNSHFLHSQRRGTNIGGLGIDELWED
jgi:hypothetical protein